MRGEGPKRALMAIALGLVATACTSSDSGPATAPPVTDPPATVPTTATAPTTTTSTPAATPTTVDRISEVEAIFKNLELQRLDALFREDEEAFGALFANNGYREQGLQVLGTLSFIAEPSADLVDLSVVEVLVDQPDCLAAIVAKNLGQTVSQAVPSENIFVLSRGDDGAWGLSFGGTGWLCVGPHPLGP